ncbi:phosphatidate cytidylyltransferase [Sporolactobacillus sp. THM7-7]|nr:phosphatidate cytidylyltransferase [Sporolactobacillus sp. THM7-7]
MRQRIITGVLAGALYLVVLVIGSIPFTLLATVIAVIAYMELAAMKKLGVFSPEVLIGALCVSAIVLGAWPGDDVFPDRRFVGALALLILLLLSATVFTRNRFRFDHAAHLLLSAFYISFSFYLLVRLREESLALLLFVQVTIWATDSGAYFIGRKWGRHKLAPRVSPNKTREGFFGAIAAALLVAVFFQLAAGDPLFSDWWVLLFVTLVVSVAGQLGDLAESAIKRYFGVKDSGNILPGHGGLFDRFDSLIFVMPILYLIGVVS